MPVGANAGACRATTQVVGRRGETTARDHLRGLGYRIIDCNVRLAGAEIDMVAWDEGTLCFVEVRSRHSLEHGHPLETIGAVKQRRLVRAAWAYLQVMPVPWPPTRFDAVGIVWGDPLGQAPAITLVRHAFEA